MDDFNLRIHSRDFDTLLDIAREGNPEIDADYLRRAYELAESSHRGQLRLSGEPYIIHPLEVAQSLARLNMDTVTIAAALLHDVVEDTGITLEELAAEFGDELARLVDGVTKISTIKKQTRYHRQVQTLRKMLIATIKDARVIIIKLADRLHNMRTIMFQAPEKQRLIASEVLDIYAPLAGRLGMSTIRSELEDHAFLVLNPEEYYRIKENLALRDEEIAQYINDIRTLLMDNFTRNGIEAEIKGRVKHLYSIYRKMVTQDKSLDEIFDIRAVRIITGEVKDCYGILGIVHSLWPPLPHRFKDYIAVPKSNMYQSLHTTVRGPGNHFLEIQIRTIEMHMTAEMGIAAHWAYKESGRQSPRRQYEEMALLKDIERWREDLKSTREFMTELKMDLYDDEIYVFTPRGEIIKLARGATTVDFAYAIHTEVGHHCLRAIVNGKIVPLRTVLENGDVVEIATSARAHPSETWLKFVRSANARSKIRAWFNRQKRENGEDESRDVAAAKEKKPPAPEKTAEFAIPENELLKIRQFSSKNSTDIVVEGNRHVLIKLAQCCQPIPGDEVIGFITRGRGISVHKMNCPSLKRLNNEPERLIRIVWADSGSSYPVKIAVEAGDREGLLKDIANDISLTKTNIVRMEAAAAKEGRVLMKFVIEVRNLEQLNEIMARLRQIGSVTSVYKVNEKVVLK
jgi:GTP pyrophosphokinase